MRMSVDSVPSVNNTLQAESVQSSKETNSPPNHSSMGSDTSHNTETKETLDKATGLLQSIVSDKITDKIIRKIPSDEYLHLLSLLDEIMSGSIDKKV